MTALLIVDLQNDFLPGGTLAVPGGDKIIPLVNRLAPQYDFVVATRDWHPADHGSFASNHPGHEVGETIELDGLPQILWPDHCIQGTPGAALARGFDTSRVDRVVPKGTQSTIDSYSAFHDNGHRHSTGLADLLRAHGVAAVHVCGLATDYCVKCTALDAVREGFATTVLEDASRGVNLHHGDAQAALQEMREAGVKTCTADEVLTRGRVSSS